MTLLEAPDNTLTPYSLVQELRSLFDDVDKKDCAHTVVHGNNQSKKTDTDEIGNKDASWKEFTPQHIDATKCLAREWNVGRGGQCGNNPLPESNVCALHTDKHTGEANVPHGFVDGPIPEKKIGVS